MKEKESQQTIDDRKLYSEVMAKDNQRFQDEMQEHMHDYEIRRDRDLFIRMRISQIKLERIKMYTLDESLKKYKEDIFRSKRNYVRWLIKELREVGYKQK